MYIFTSTPSSVIPMWEASARAASRDANTKLGNTHVGASARAASRETKGARTVLATGCSLPRLGLDNTRNRLHIST